MPVNTPPTGSPIPLDLAPGSKTTLVAAVFTVLQALVMGGFLPDVSEQVSQISTGVFAVTLGLKGLRNVLRRSR